MRGEGVVCSVAAGTARVALNAAGCARCGSCGVCREQRKAVEIDVDAPDGIRPGDRVAVDIPGPGMARSVMLLLVIPLVAFFAGAALGEWLRARGSITAGSWFSFLLALALMALAYLGAGLHDRRIRKAPETRARIIEVLGAPPADTPGGDKP